MWDTPRTRSGLSDQDGAVVAGPEGTQRLQARRVFTEPNPVSSTIRSRLIEKRGCVPRSGPADVIAPDIRSSSRICVTVGSRPNSPRGRGVGPTGPQAPPAPHRGSPLHRRAMLRRPGRSRAAATGRRAAARITSARSAGVRPPRRRCCPPSTLAGDDCWPGRLKKSGPTQAAYRHHRPETGGNGHVARPDSPRERASFRRSPQATGLCGGFWRR